MGKDTANMVCATCGLPAHKIGDSWFHTVPEGHPALHTIVRAVKPAPAIGQSAEGK